MRGQRIAMVNNALENIFSELRQRDDLHAVIKVSIMTFAEKAQWVTPNPIRLEDYVRMKLTTVPWITCYAPAFDELSRVLRRERFHDPSLGEYYAPLILFVTDGEPTDFDEYPGALSRLRRNGWFRKATKYAIATGVEAQNKDTLALLAEFTGVRENVRYTDEGEALCDMIQFVAARASEVQTSAASSSDSNAGIPSVFPKECYQACIKRDAGAGGKCAGRRPQGARHGVPGLFAVYAGEGWLCAAVADGHGSRKHFRSGRGAARCCWRRKTGRRASWRACACRR